MKNIVDLIVNGENKYIEFKRIYSKTMLKSVSAYANYHDGKILIGIDDDGTVVGVENPIEIRMAIENSIRDNLSPVPYYEIDTASLDDKVIIVITVYKGENTPYFSDGKTYKRMDSSSAQVGRYDLNELILSGKNLSFETLPCANMDLEFTYFEKRIRESIGIGILTKDTMRTLELMTNEKFNNAAALLSDENPIENSRMILLKYEPESMMDIRDRNIIVNTSLVKQFDEALDFYKKHINVSEIIDGAIRKTVEEVPLVAYREAVANAIVHRDYSKPGDIKIEFFSDRVEVISPGSLPLGISESEFYEGRISVPRNRIISDIFLRLKIIERLATGIRRIKAYYKDYQIKPVFDVSENTIKIVLPHVSYIKKEDKGIYQKRRYETLGKGEAQIVNFINQKGSITRKEAQSILGLKKTQTYQVIKNMQINKILIKIGSGRTIEYVLANDKK